jgi:hypothetical protein
MSHSGDLGFISHFSQASSIDELLAAPTASHLFVSLGGDFLLVQRSRHY